MSIVRSVSANQPRLPNEPGSKPNSRFYGSESGAKNSATTVVEPLLDSFQITDVDGDPNLMIQAKRTGPSAAVLEVVNGPNEGSSEPVVFSVPFSFEDGTEGQLFDRPLLTPDDKVSRVELAARQDGGVDCAVRTEANDDGNSCFSVSQDCERVYRPISTVEGGPPQLLFLGGSTGLLSS